MDHRDEFAARAMQALIEVDSRTAAQATFGVNTVAGNKVEIARAAYEIADAMMEARR